MYNLLTLSAGLIIAIMVVFNGELTAQYGVFTAAVIVHIVGTVFAGAVLKITGRKLLPPKGLPFWLYTGGLLGVLTTIFNNFSYGKISLTSIIAMGLFGQTVTSLIIDCTGLFGMEKHSLKKSSLAGILFSSLGIFVMLDNSIGTALYAVLFSFAAGITIVLSRTVNGRLSDHTNALQGSFLNHLAGLPATVAIALLFERSNLAASIHTFSPRIWIYLGGVLGVMVVLLFNMVVMKVSAFRITLLSFVGQVFTGILIDLFTKGSYSFNTFLGGLLVSAGIVISLIWEQLSAKKASA